MLSDRIRRLFGSRTPRARHVIGLACTGHGASLAYVGRNGIVRSSVFDRWIGTKHTLLLSADEARDLQSPVSPIDVEIHRILRYVYRGFPPTQVFEETFPPWMAWFLRGLGVGAGDIDLVVTSEGHFVTSPLRLGKRLREWFPNAVILTQVEHHAVHQRQAFWQSGFRDAAVVTLDTCGEPLARLGGRKLAGTISAMNAKGECQVLSEMFFPESSLGLLYDIVTHHVGFKQGDEGKTMGLAPYGRPDLSQQLLPHLQLFDDGHFRFLDLDAFHAALAGYCEERAPDQSLTPRHEDVAFAGQQLLERIVTNALHAAVRLTGSRHIAYAGGVALNSVANQTAFDTVRPLALYIPPNPGDTGHALGCALMGAYEFAEWRPPLRELQEYLGPPYSGRELEQAVRTSGFVAAKPRDLPLSLARAIADGFITARFDGAAEFGPRALGNRSILCDPRRPDMPNRLNRRVKHREAFRPFAPTVLLERAADWFEIEGRSPYMLRVVRVRPDVRDRIPAVVHVDGTGRVQTLTESENPGLCRIIRAFDRLTGVPLVLNTSFNVAGKPIVETPDDAIACFASTEIDLLALGPFLLSKRPLTDQRRAEHLATSGETGARV